MPQKKRRSNKIRSTFDKLLAFKIVDPVIQSLLLIYYFYALDGRANLFKTVFWYLLSWQIISLIVNWFLSFHKKLKTERLAFSAIVVLWMGVYFYVTYRIKEVQVTNFEIREFAQSGVHDFYVMLAGLLVASWYFSISFREVRSVARKIERSNG